MNLQQAIEIIDNIIAGVNCNRQQRQTIENAFRIIVDAAMPNAKKLVKSKEEFIKKKVDAE